jgi:uncharacterized protein
MSDIQVTNNVELSRFEIHDQAGRLAGYSEYIGGDRFRAFVHTVVEDEYEGQGIGSRLARGALDQTRADDLKVIATCEFIKGWIAKHPGYEDLLA